MIIIGYSAYYVVTNKERLFPANEVSITGGSGIRYVAPNKLDNPGHIYAEKDGASLWHMDMSNIPVDADLAKEPNLRDYKVTSLSLWPFEGRDAVWVRLGKGSSARIYILDTATGNTLKITTAAVEGL
jgi:hypothetical protein